MLHHRSVAIIPARGGSKRVPRKNLALIAGKPIIAWVIETALQSKTFERIIVTSEDDEILQVSMQNGADVYKRPAELADDLTHVGPVVNQCIEALSIDSESICLIYATALLLHTEHLVAAHSLLLKPDVQSVLSIAEYDSPIQRAYAMLEDGRIEMALPEFFSWRSQDLPARYRDAAMFSWWKRPTTQGSKMGFLVPKSCAVDIDTPEDLEIATALFERRQRFARS